MRGRKDCVWPIFRRSIFFCREALSATLKKQGMIYFYCSLALSPTKLHSCTHVSASLSCALAARDANERAKRERERERSEVVVGRYAHHKFYFCRETDGQKKIVRASCSICAIFFLLFFCDNFATKTNHGIVWAMYSVSVSRYFFVLFFRDFCPLNVVFISRLCEWGDFLNAFYRR